MNEQEFRNYLKNPTNTPLNGFSFRVNYSNLRSEMNISIEDNDEFKRLISINRDEYEPKEIFFSFLLRFNQFINSKKNLREIVSINPQSDQEQILNLKFNSNELSFINSCLTLIKNQFICEIEYLSEGSVFLFKMYSLDTSGIESIKNEVTELVTSHNSIIGQIEDISSSNAQINKLYVLTLLNFIMFDFESADTKYNFFGNTSIEIKLITKSLFGNLNLSYFRNNKESFIGSIALTSLFIENRLVKIYEEKIDHYQDDKTLGELMASLKQPTNHLSDIERALNSFKNIRNNIVHFNRRSFDRRESFMEVICYFGQFLIWCEENGYL